MSGVPTRPLNLERRLQELEDEVRALRIEVSHRIGEFNWPRDVYLVRTTDLGNYPASGGTGNLIVPIEFVDGAYAKNTASFSETLNWSGRQGTAVEYGCNPIAGEYIEANTVCMALRQRAHFSLSGGTETGHWWLFPFGGTEGDTATKPLCRFTLDAALTTSDPSKSATITNQYGAGTNNASTAITAHNLQVSDNSYMFEGDSGDVGYAYLDSGTNYYILQLECV